MKIGLALGGGGAKGIAHIVVLEALDELGVKPSIISGTSIGSIIGAAYAAGQSAEHIREDVLSLSSRKSFFSNDKTNFGWFEFVQASLSSGSMLRADKFIAALIDDVGAATFEDLTIPLKVVAADFWNRQQVVFDSGPLDTAIRASIALPGIFEPVSEHGRLLVDGGAVNPVPYDLLFGACDFTIAVDVMGQRSPNEDLRPSLSEAVFNTYQIMERSITMEKMKHNPPDLYVEPEIDGVRVLEFFKAEEILNSAGPIKDQVIRALEQHLA